MLARSIVIATLCVSAAVPAAPPELYHQSAYESPVHGKPDDLLLLAGYGLAIDDTVVYRAVPTATDSIATPSRLPANSSADLGVASVVSSKDVPYSLTIKLPQIMHADRVYALWVRTARGEWSKPVEINQVRPYWISPEYVYASAAVASLPRELKIVGRNLQSIGDRSTRIRLVGPKQYTGTAVSDARSSAISNEYVARLQLPAVLAPGTYRIQVSRDSSNWVEVPDQSLEVIPNPPSAGKFTVSDPQFGGCRPNDGADDTACILRAIDAATHAGGGTVYFGPGTWDLIDGNQPGLVTGEGIYVPPGVQLRGAGSGLTRLERHREWNEHSPTAAFTLVGDTLVTGFTFRDLQIYRPSDRAGPYLQLGRDSQAASVDTAVVNRITITANIFDKPLVAIGGGDQPIRQLFITYNTFGAYHSALELGGNPFNVIQKYRIDDSVIDYNIFKPGSELDVTRKTGAIASELGAGHRVDFSGNTADGASTEYLNAPDDAKGWRAAFFWNLDDNVEEVLVSQNTATCTGDKIGDGESFAFDNNTNTFAFGTPPLVAKATASSVTISPPPAARQNGREVPVANYYVDHWVQVVSGPGLGQARKIIGYSTNPITHLTTLRVAPEWDVVPISGQTRIAVGREFWQLYVLDNQVDNREPLCQKSNRSRHAAGAIVLWAQSADSSIAGNRQYDSDGIFVQQAYVVPEHPCADCTMQGYFQSFLEIRANVVDGEYDWTTDCSASGIAIGVGAAPWGEAISPTVGFGVSISHNTIRHADAEHGGAIAQLNSWYAGPEPHRWPLSDNLIIQHNSIADIGGPRALPICGASRPPRIGIAFPESQVAWRTVLYANSCKNVPTPVGGGGVDMVNVCPSSVPDSCECPQTIK
jgi:hypothetical protein